jgi:hypothetical protein
MIRLWRKAARAAAGLMVMCCTLASAAADAAPPTTTGSACAASCGRIAAGNAADNAETSRAIDAILRRCAELYSHTPSLVAHGRVLAQVKIDSSRSIVRGQSLELAFSRPDRLKIVVRQPSGDLTAQFVADGKNLLMVWDPQLHMFGGVPANLVYRLMPQPPSLASFCDEEYAGDLYDDETVCISASAVAPLLVSADPLAWLHSHVTEYYYDGVEQVEGRCCHRIRFYQADPDMAVTQWIECETALLRKLVVVRATTDAGTPMWSLTAAASGEMMEAVFDDVTTAPKAEDLRFVASAPAGVKEAAAAVRQMAASSSPAAPFLQRLLRAAISSSQEKTSASVDRQWPAPRWRVGNSWRFVTRIAGVSHGRPGWVALVTRDGKAWRLDRKGLAALPTNLDFAPDMVVPWRAGKSWNLLLARSGGPWLAAVDEEGRTLWERTLAGSVLCMGLNDEESSPRLWLGMTGGLSILDTQGRGIYSVRRQRALAQVEFATHATLGKVVVGLSLEKPDLWLYDLSGHPLRRVRPEDRLLGMEAAVPASDLFLVGGISREGNELALRGLGMEGETLWTVMIAPRMERLGGDFSSVRVKDVAGTQQHFVAITPTGRLREVDSRGQLVWDGQLGLDSVSTLLTGDSLGNALTAADVDGDGFDELFVAAEKDLFMLVPAAQVPATAGSH